MDDATPDDWSAAIVYRLAYGLAADVLEAGKFSMAHGRTRPITADRLLAEVARQLGIDPADRGALGVVREGVEDAQAGRRPRW